MISICATMSFFALKVLFICPHLAQMASRVFQYLIQYDLKFPDVSRQSVASTRLWTNFYQNALISQVVLLLNKKLLRKMGYLSFHSQNLSVWHLQCSCHKYIVCTTYQVLDCKLHEIEQFIYLIISGSFSVQGRACYILISQ